MSNSASSEDVAEHVAQLVAAAIRNRRQQLSLSQAQVAQEIGISHQQMQKLETGENRISAGRLGLLCKVLDVEVSHFYLKASELMGETRSLNSELFELRSQVFAQVSKVQNILALRTLKSALDVILTNEH